MKEKIFSDVQRLGKARVDFVDAVRDFAQQIVALAKETTGGTLYLGRSVKGSEFFVKPKYSNIGRDFYLFIWDGYGERALNEARVGGGYEFLHSDFNARVEYATYSDCQEFVAYMRDEFGPHVEECVKKIEERMTFFKSNPSNP